MNEAPPLSVVMPVHNGMPFVGESVASILAQSYRDFEFVVGDDGSSDGTTELLAGLADRDRRIRILRRERKSGLSASANWVIGEARAPLIAIAHADDLSRPDRLRRQIELMERDPTIDLVGTLWEGVDERGRRVRPADYWRLVAQSAFAPFSHSSVMFRRAAFDRVGGYRPEAEYWEDFDLYLRIAEKGRVVILPEVLSIVRHALVSARIRNDPTRVENAVDLMYRCAAAYRRGEDHGALLKPGAREPGSRLAPLTFVSCGSTRLWSGRRPGVMKRMWRRAKLGPNAASLKTLIWVSWATLSPGSLRLCLRAALHARRLMVRRRLGDAPYVEWRPRAGG